MRIRENLTGVILLLFALGTAINSLHNIQVV